MTHEQLVEEMKQLVRTENKNVAVIGLDLFDVDRYITTTAQRVREERIEEVIQKARADECNAWLDGRRCYECGNEKEVTPLSDTCRQCWETA